MEVENCNLCEKYERVLRSFSERRDDGDNSPDENSEYQRATGQRKRSSKVKRGDKKVFVVKNTKEAFVVYI